MKLVQDIGSLQPQVLDIMANAIDRRQFADVVTDTADTEFEIEHGLNFIPVGCLIILQDKAAQIYLSTTERTAEKIYLKCNVADVSMRILIF